MWEILPEVLNARADASTTSATADGTSSTTSSSQTSSSAAASTETTTSAATTSSNSGVVVTTPTNPVSSNSDSGKSSMQISSQTPTNNGSAILTNSTSGPSTPPSAHSTHAHATISDGAIAGISIATFALGAALALLGFWVFSRRRGSRSRKRRNPQTPVSNRHTFQEQSRGSISNKRNATRTGEISMDDYSPTERLDDSQIRRHMQNLEELIHQHAENHYHNRLYTGHQENLKVSLTRCGYTDQSEVSLQMMTSLLVDPSNRITAIRSLIASVILRAVDLKNSPEDSLLPDVITQFYHIIPKKRRANEQDNFDKCLARWRQLSAYLLSSNSTHRESSLQLADHATTRIVEILNTVLRPFTRSSKSESRSPTQVENLASIIQEGKEFGMLLLEQPGTWVLGWELLSKRGSKIDPKANNEIVVFPSLGEVISKGGRAHLRVIIEVVRERI
ncbi:hypothetical protein ACMFMG_011361 [Clarireedia jacksonii]